MAAVSVLVGTAAAEDRQVATVLPEVQAVEDPHLQVDDVQMLLSGAAHFAAEPHIQLPAVQESESPVQTSKSHGATKNKVE